MSEFASELEAQAYFARQLTLGEVPESRYVAWMHTADFYTALRDAHNAINRSNPREYVVLLERTLAHWRKVLKGCTWREQFYKDLVAFDECRGARHTPETVNMLLLVAVSLGRCDLIRELERHFQPTMSPDYARIILAIRGPALLPVIDLLLNMGAPEQKRAGTVIAHLATVEFLPTSFFALSSVYSGYQLVSDAPPDALPILESYGVVMEPERHLVEMLSGGWLHYPRARYFVAKYRADNDGRDPDAAVALARCSTAYFVLFDDATRAKLHPEMRECIEVASTLNDWAGSLVRADLHVLDNCRLPVYDVLHHIPEKFIADANRRRRSD